MERSCRHVGRSRGKISSADEILKPAPIVLFGDGTIRAGGGWGGREAGWGGREAKFLQLMSRSVGVETVNPTPILLAELERSSGMGYVPLVPLTDRAIRRCVEGGEWAMIFAQPRTSAESSKSKQFVLSPSWGRDELIRVRFPPRGCANSSG